MKVLFDHNLPRRLRALLPAHDVRTTRDMGWETLRNGELLRVAADAGFDAVIAVDKKLEYEQNLAKLPIPVIVLDAQNNSFDGVSGFADPLNAVLGRQLGKWLYVVALEGQVVEVRQPRPKNG